MKKYWWFILSGLFVSAVFAQENNRLGEGALSDKGEQEKKAKINQYKIISLDEEVQYVDTTLTLQKDYQFNYLRKDNFGLLPFSNIGQPYTLLTQDFNSASTLPDFGARAAHFAFLEPEDIYYYEVATPFTDLMFKTTFNQGQLLDAFFTSNISPQINFSIAHKGLHSQGHYQHIRTKQSSFRATFSYKSKNNRYLLNTHFIGQRLPGDQNGGLTDLANEQYRSKNKDFQDREVLDVKYENADRNLRAKRFFVKQYYKLIVGDSLENNSVRIGHQLNFTDKEYYYNQSTPFDPYGGSFISNEVRDLTEFQEVSNQFYANYRNQLLGSLLFGIQHENYNYGYKRKLILNNVEIPNRLKGDVTSIGAKYENRIGGFKLSGDAMLNTTGDWDGNYLRAKAEYEIDSINKIEASLMTNSHKPNYNFLLYQSDYTNYNWRNDFHNIQKQNLNFHFLSQKWVDMEVDYTRIHNYTYFYMRENTQSNGLADSLMTPAQYDKDVHYVKIKAKKELKMGKFALDNTILYQDVLKGSEVFHQPKFITRNTFYYSDFLFQHNLFLQTGVTFNHFTSYYADGYDPVMNEYYVQDLEKLKGFSRLDLFLNAKVQTARVFFKLENFTTLMDKNGKYAASHEPYRDWAIRFGIIWDFFW